VSEIEGQGEKSRSNLLMRLSIKMNVKTAFPDITTHEDGYWLWLWPRGQYADGRPWFL